MKLFQSHRFQMTPVFANLMVPWAPNSLVQAEPVDLKLVISRDDVEEMNEDPYMIITSPGCSYQLNIWKFCSLYVQNWLNV